MKRPANLKILAICIGLMAFLGLTAQPPAYNGLSDDELLGLLSGADPVRAPTGNPGFSRKAGRPIIFLIGDSTVKNGRGDGSNHQWGWGCFLAQFLDTTLVSVENYAIGGRSSRTFIEEGRWESVINALQPGDYVLVQFGHNDAGPLNTGRARATLRGNHDNDTTVVMEADGKTVIIRSFGWYMRRYACEARDKGATPVLMSHIPRNQWTTVDSVHIRRNSDSFGAWTREAAAMASAPYIDLNQRIADKYETLGKTIVPSLFHGDHTHTSFSGAMLNAKTVAEAIIPILNRDGVIP